MITFWMFSFDVHKLKFKVSIRFDVFELRYDEICNVRSYATGGWVAGWLAGWNLLNLMIA